jgi:tetratricopeptide (TPR) repeat protein
MQPLNMRSMGWLTTIVIANSLGGILLVATANPVQSQTEPDVILREEAVLQPIYQEHTFTATAGEPIRISVTSDQFDTVLSLVNPDGEEIAYNDDYGGSLNSTIITTVPADGTYTIQVRAFGGSQFGDYTLTVSVATPYEAAYGEGWSLYLSGEYDAALEALDRAIALDPDQPDAYLTRVDVLYALAQQLRPEERQAIIDNYRQLQQVYERNGNAEAAQSIQAEIEFLESEGQF